MSERKLSRREALSLLGKPLVGLYGGVVVAALVGVDRVITVDPAINEVNKELDIPSEQEVEGAWTDLRDRSSHSMTNYQAREILFRHARADYVKQEQLLKERGIWERKRVGELVAFGALLVGVISGFRYKPF